MTSPPYLRIAGEIRDRIAAGDLRPGQAVPSARQITRDWGVALATATKVLATLQQDGLVSVVPGIGTVVAQDSKPAVQRPRRTTGKGEPPRERIVRAAMEIADRDGIAEVSMRRVATELGVATMSLYRHVPGKDELILFMIDAAMAELPEVPSGDLRTSLTAVAHRQWNLFKAHPWLAAVISVSRPQLVPNGMRLTDQIIGLLTGAGLSLQDSMYIHIMMFSYVRGLATAIEPEVQAWRDSGMSVDEFMATQEDQFTAIVAGSMPHLARLFDESFDFDLDGLFEFGLARLLDGLAAFIQDRRS
jgi:AcrR family transcriptional regulator